MGHFDFLQHRELICNILYTELILSVPFNKAKWRDVNHQVLSFALGTPDMVWLDCGYSDRPTSSDQIYNVKMCLENISQLKLGLKYL